MSAPLAVFDAATVAVTVSVSPGARVLAVQVAAGVPEPAAAPLGAALVVQETPVTMPFVNTSALLKPPVPTPEVLSSVAV